QGRSSSELPPMPMPETPVLARSPGMASRAVGMFKAPFSPLLASLFSVFLYRARERSRGFPLVLCGFRGEALWLVTAWMGRPELLWHDKQGETQRQSR